MKNSHVLLSALAALVTPAAWIHQGERFLPSPQGEKEIEYINLFVNYFSEVFLKRQTLC